MGTRSRAPVAPLHQAKGCPAPKKTCLASRRPRPGRLLPSPGHAAAGGRLQQAQGGNQPAFWGCPTSALVAATPPPLLGHASTGSRMRLLITRPRIQYDSTAVYEPLDVEYKSEDLLVSELKNMIYKRQLMLSTGEDRKLPKEDSPVALEPHDQILLIRKFRDAHMQGVLLEDHRSLKFTG